MKQLTCFLAGRWQEGTGEGIALCNPVSGEKLASVSSSGINLSEALQFSRQAGLALRQKRYAERAEMVGKIAELLASNRDKYFEISQKNSGATKGDASFDVDGAIYTLKIYARMGKTLGDAHHINDGQVIALDKAGMFQAQHFFYPLTGVAIMINAFNFPAWGFWEKAAPALIAGMPMVVKPATPTAWLTHEMVADVIKADIVPLGAISILCGGAGDLLDHVEECDVISFTGSAETAEKIRAHPKVLGQSVRVNIEADSLNAAILGANVAENSATFALMVQEIVREMSVKSGQKCTAIRRIFAPEQTAKALARAVSSKLAELSVGDPKIIENQMGPLVSVAQKKSAQAGLQALTQECQVLFGGEGDFKANAPTMSEEHGFFQPTLLWCEQGLTAKAVHELEVFGPVATIMPYTSTEDEASLITMIRKGRGSLVASIYADNSGWIEKIVYAIADLHGRILVVNESVGATHSGHGNVLPQCLHGGPGRAGGGEELGGLRALLFYHRRGVMQAPSEIIASMRDKGVSSALIY